MPNRFVATPQDSVNPYGNPIFLLAGTQGLKVTGIFYTPVSGIGPIRLRRVTAVTGGYPGSVASLDDPAPTPFATVVCGGNPAWTEVSTLGQWIVTGTIDLAESGPIEVSAGGALMAETPGYATNIYFEE